MHIFIFVVVVHGDDEVYLCHIYSLKAIPIFNSLCTFYAVFIILYTIFGGAMMNFMFCVLL